MGFENSEEFSVASVVSSFDIVHLLKSEAYGLITVGVKLGEYCAHGKAEQVSPSLIGEGRVTVANKIWRSK